MVVLETIIRYLYFAFAAIVGLFLLKNLFRREKRQGLTYDIVYAYCIIPFLLRLLWIK
ncbi:hypothetical protein ACH6CV_13425 [Bacillota bacterium Meth-B3]|nr:hypothetical protein [Christensenellaceae bacterium]MEA5066644.1 hypothetical protein [Eubacteriales bacterium]MEA5067893.1 hypothetical protein [Christensenellaceae bacterium]